MKTPEKIYGFFEGRKSGKIIETPQESVRTKMIRYGIIDNPVVVEEAANNAHANPSTIEEDDLFVSEKYLNNEKDKNITGRDNVLQKVEKDFLPNSAFHEKSGEPI